MKEDKTGRKSEQELLLLEKERTHPTRTLLFFSLVGSSLLFLSMVIMFIIWMTHNTPTENFKLPKEFTVSTIILLISSYLVTIVRRQYKADNDRGLLLSLTGVLICSFFFSLLQLSGWKNMLDQGFLPNKDIGTGLVYAISGFHFLHLGAGMVYLFYLWLKSFDIWNDPVRSLLYFSNKYEGVRLELFSNYWHYVDGLWLFIFLSFLFIF